MMDFGFYNMDCMEGMKEFPDKYFDLAIVDPPYGGVTKGGYMRNNEGVKYKNAAAYEKGYHTALWEQERPGSDYFAELFRVSKNQIIWGGNYFANDLPESQCWIVWDKLHPETITFADVELAWTSFNKAARIFRFTWNGMIQGNMKHKENRQHPSQKPVELYRWILNRFAEEGDIILDTHVGSASSLIACHELGHPYVGFEIDETYYNDACKRLSNETDQISFWSMGYNPYQE